MMEKKLFILFLFVAVSSCMLTSCGISVKGANGETYNSYQECCAANDYDAAHAYLAKMKNAIGDDYDKEREFNEAHEYVFKKEALFLMSIGSEDAKKRIIYLLKEEENNNNHVDMLIDLAIENNDEEFVKSLANQYDRYSSESQLKKIVEYLSANHNDENKSYIMALLTKLNKRQILLEAAVTNNDIYFVQNNRDLVSIRDRACITKLSQMNNTKVSDIIFGALLSEESSIPHRPSIGKVNAGYSDGYSRVQKECNNYISAVKKYNSQCNDLLNIAISTKNMYLAQKAKAAFKPNISYQSWDNPKDSYFWFIISLDNSDITEATTTLQNALRSGVFK